jgi:hypothetical protein
MLRETAQPQTGLRMWRFTKHMKTNAGFAGWLASSKGLLDPPEVPLPIDDFGSLASDFCRISGS